MILYRKSEIFNIYTTLQSTRNTWIAATQILR